MPGLPQMGSGYYDADGNWVSAGYDDQGNQGFYDSQGNWLGGGVSSSSGQPTSGGRQSTGGGNQTSGGQPGMPGHPNSNGMVGQPNLGQSNSLQQWAQQMDSYYGNGAGTRYLQSLGMLPQTYQMGVSGPGGSSGAGGAMGQPGNPWAGAQQTAPGEWRLADGSMSGGPNPMSQGGAPSVPGASAAGHGANLASVANRGGAPAFSMGAHQGQVSTSGPRTPSPAIGAGGVGGQGTYSGRESSPFERQLQGAIGNRLQNPTGLSDQQTQMLRNQAAAPYAGQEAQNAQDIRADAVRRGAATSDADIRSQLNQSNMAGAQAQQQASTGMDLQLAQLGQQGGNAAMGAGNQLVGSQLGDVKSLREMQTLLAQYQMQNGPFSPATLQLQL